MLTSRDVNEIADAPAGAVPQALAIKPADTVNLTEGQTSTHAAPTKMSYASVSRGTVKFEEEKKE